jgi:NADP-dependent 3-hydroxy acid dehydrogenase YdfG
MSNTRQSEGKVVVVTGAGTGMGGDTAILLAERGAKVAIVGRREARLRDIEAKILGFSMS